MPDPFDRNISNIRNKIVDNVNNNINNAIKNKAHSLLNSALNKFNNITGINIVGASTGTVYENITPKQEYTIDALENTLNQYINTQYHIYFSMVSEKKAKEYQKNGLNSTTIEELENNNDFKVFASTGDVYSRSKSNNDNGYYNITTLELSDIMEPSSNDTMIATVQSMKMTIEEPFGLNFTEELARTACDMGYNSVNTIRVLHRIDIHFSGYDINTGEWVKKIPFSQNSDVKHLSYLLQVVGSSVAIKPEGTTYELSLVPVQMSAFNTDAFTVYAGVQLTGNTFREFLASLVTRLETTKDQVTNGQIVRKYEFYGPSKLLDSPFDIPSDDSLALNFLNDPKIDATRVSGTGMGIDIETILEGVLANTVYVQEAFVADSEEGVFIQPRNKFTIRCNVIYGDKDPDLNDYRTITYQFFLVPFLTYKGTSTRKGNIKQIMSLSSQEARSVRMKSLGMIRKIYQYIGMPNNTEVISMDITPANYFRNTLDTLSRAMDSTYNQQNNSLEKIDHRNRDVLNISISDDKAVMKAGQRITNSNNTNLVCHNTNEDLKFGSVGTLGEKPDNRKTGDVSSNANMFRDIYDRHIKDFFSVAFIDLSNLQIKGDPDWLIASDGYNNINSARIDGINAEGVTSEGVKRAIIYPKVAATLFMEMAPNTQEDYMNPDRKGSTSSPNHIKGFYTINSVTSKFVNGKFLQSLTGFKLDTMNYFELNIKK